MRSVVCNKYFRVAMLAVLAAMASPSTAQVRKYSNEFLNIGVGARGLAMSGAQVASVNDVTSGYWNPAGMANITQDFQIALMHSEYFAGIAKFDYGSVAVPLKGKDKVIGLSVVRFGVDDIPNTLNLFDANGQVNYDNISSFSVGDYAGIISYAQKIKKVEGLRVGGNVKVIYRQAGSFATAWGFGLDVGAQYDRKGVHMGLMAKDVTSTFNAWSFNFSDDEKAVLTSTGNDIPTSSLEITVPQFIFGAAYEVNIKNKFFILPEIDVDLTTDGKRNVPIKTNAVSIDPRFGLEMNYARIVYVRFGVGNIQKGTDDVTGKSIVTWQPNIGAGVHFKGVGIDYAFTDIGNQSQSLYSHVISLNVGFNKRKK